MLQLDISGMDKRHLEPMQVQVRKSFACEDAGGAVMIGMNVRDNEPAQSLCPNLSHRRPNGVNRLFCIHAAIQQIGVVSVWKEKDIDEAVLEWNRQAKLEHIRCHLGKSKLGRHDSGIVAQRGRVVAHAPAWTRG
jgi:hypothetical protein